MSSPTPSSILIKESITKLYDVPFSYEIIALNIGKKSAQLLATSSTDGYIRLWRLLKPVEPLLEINIATSINEFIQAHQSISSSQVFNNMLQANVKVLSMCFDSKEELLVGGVGNGNLFLWDLNKSKLLRLFQGGHSAQVNCVDFSPYGDFFASGSVDCTVKTWCVTRKNCLQTYKGHPSPISTVRFTPDGRWLASGDVSGNLKLWDLAPGIILAQFSSHSDAIIAIDYHPKDLFLATGSKDGSVKFWDLDTFKEVSSTSKNATDPVQAISFTPDGKYLLCLSKMYLRIWSWEPDRLHQEIRIDWEGVSDFAIIHGLKNGFAVANKKNKLASWCIVLEKLAPYTKNYIEPPIIPSENVQPLQDSDSDTPETKNTTIETKKLLNHLGSSQDNLRSELRKFKRRQELMAKFKKNNTKNEHRSQTPNALYNGGVLSYKNEKDDNVNEPLKTSSGDNVHKSGVVSRSKKSPSYERDENGNINYVQIPKTSSKKDSNFDQKKDKPSSVVPNSDGELLSYILDSQPTMKTIISSRIASLKLISRLWHDDFKLEAIQHLDSMEDLAVTVEVTKHITNPANVNYITLQLCKNILKLIIPLLDSKIEPFILCGIHAVDILDRKFYVQVKQSLRTPQLGRNSDTPEDSRMNRSRKCRQLFLTVRDQLENLRTCYFTIGQKAESLHTQLSHYRRI